MRKALAITLIGFALFLLTASVAASDVCACGGYLFNKSYHVPEDGGAGHWDCLYYLGDGNFNIVHGC